MKVPFSWLKELRRYRRHRPGVGGERLFSCGFEVEELIPLDAGISKVVVGKITSMEKQEGTHLTKCVVDCGEYGHEIHISTGAANMKAGRLRPRRPGWLHPARRHQDQGPQDAGCGVQRYALLRCRSWA